MTEAERAELQRLQDEAHDLDDLVTAYVRDRGSVGPDYAEYRKLVDDAEAASARWVAYARRITKRA